MLCGFQIYSNTLPSCLLGLQLVTVPLHYFHSQVASTLHVNLKTQAKNINFKLHMIKSLYSRAVFVASYLLLFLSYISHQG